MVLCETRLKCINEQKIVSLISDTVFLLKIFCSCSNFSKLNNQNAKIKYRKLRPVLSFWAKKEKNTMVPDGTGCDSHDAFLVYTKAKKIIFLILVFSKVKLRKTILVFKFYFDCFQAQSLGIVPSDSMEPCMWDSWPQGYNVSRIIFYF